MTNTTEQVLLAKSAHQLIKLSEQLDRQANMLRYFWNLYKLEEDYSSRRTSARRDSIKAQHDGGISEIIVDKSGILRKRPTK